VAPRPLTGAQRRAALLVAEDERTDEEIAAACKVHKATLERWKQRPDFAEAVAEHREAFRQRLLSEGFADKARRVQALNAIALDLMRQLRDADYKAVIGVSDTGEPIEAFDRARLREFREYLADIAEEMGDRGSKADKPSVNVNVGVGVAVSLPPEERVERLAGLLARVHAGRD
jgi:hypothetical protein